MAGKPSNSNVCVYVYMAIIWSQITIKPVRRIREAIK